jgi:hypothetical protein
MQLVVLTLHHLDVPEWGGRITQAYDKKLVNYSDDQHGRPGNEARLVNFFAIFLLQSSP